MSEEFKMGEYYGNNDWRDYKTLKHYGVKGMKWRKRKAPMSLEEYKRLHPDAPISRSTSTSSNTATTTQGSRPLKRKKKVTSGGHGVQVTGQPPHYGRVGYYFKPVKPTIKSKIGLAKYYINASKDRWKRAGIKDPSVLNVLRTANYLRKKSRERGKEARKARAYLRRQQTKKKVLATISGISNRRKGRR